ncbi:hypothetical protein [Natrialba taiwanensis]|uniref:Envelope protein N-terminal domain-containing protein n=1 Tax=Natrialba taiwanensis DSM 12281 TaxID=1230458 RepID=L9ZXS0_9EURY|nr:hypothetical protein [Natrialba taiwanensis]ELY90881.1 hypothetical protein C484_11676 [Natrialba taiwanensis DSM 12281]
MSAGPQPTDHEVESGESVSLTRRDLFRRTAATGTALGGMMLVGDRVVPQFSPIGRARAIALATAATLASGAAIAGIVVGAIATGSDDSTEQILEKRSNELHDRIWTDANEMQMVQEPMMESLEGDVSSLRQLSRSDAAFEIMQAASDEAGESTAQSNAKDAVRNAFAKVEANFFDAYSAQVTKVLNRSPLVADDSNLEVFDVFRWVGNGDLESNSEEITKESTSTDYEGTAELVNGETHPVSIINVGTAGSTLVPWSEASGSTSPSVSPLQNFDADGNYTGSASNYYWGLTAKDRESGNTIDMLDSYEWWKIHDELLTILDDELTHVETMVSNLYQPAVDGEIDVHSISSGSAILEEARDGDLSSWKEAAGIFRAMWMGEASDAAVIELENGVQIEGQLFWTDPADEGLPVGDSINPDNTIGRLYMAGELRTVPETQSETATVTITVVDGAGTAISDALIDVKGGDTTHSVNSDGEATIDVSAGHTTFYVTDEDGTTSETAVSMDIADGDSVQITHDGSDSSSYQVDPFADDTITPEDEGTVVVPHLKDSFTVLGVNEKPDAKYLEFNVPDQVEPSDDFQTYKERSEDAADREQETREETTKVIIEETGGDGGLGLPTFFGGDGGGLIGLGIIAVAVLAVVGFVTDMIPGLGE